MEKQFARVCVGIDGSADADVALDWAARFAVRHDSQVEPIYAWEYPALSISPGPVMTAITPESVMFEAGEKLAAAALERWNVDGRMDARVTAPVVLHGHPARTLVSRSADADLLVVGSRGYGSVKSLILGSVSSACAANTQCPLVIVPKTTGGRRVEKVVIGHDGSAQADAALDWAVAAYPDATFEIIHAWRLAVAAQPFDLVGDYDWLEARAGSAVETAVARANKSVSAVTGHVVMGDARTELNRVATEADLLVIGVQAAHGVGRVFMGSTAQAVVHHLRVPTVIVPVEE